MNCIEALDQMHPYIDGELDLLRALAVEVHFFSCVQCRHLHAQHAGARTMLRRHATCFAAPAALRERVQHRSARIVHRRAVRSWLPARVGTWPAFGAALAFSIFATWTVSMQFVVSASSGRLPEEIVASHLRAQMAAQPVDIASSDPHDVTPWLSRKLGYSPYVRDLAADGYTLVGSRIDYVREHRVAALAYRHRGHAIDVFAWPATARDMPMHELSRKGYNLVNWTSNGMFYCAVSDLDHAELATLAQLFQRDSG
jgi:anti-sigma factor RsiW